MIIDHSFFLLFRVLDGLRDNPQFNGGPNADGPLLNNVQEIMVAILQIRDPDILED